MSDTAWQIVWGFGGILAGVVLVHGPWFVRFWIERRRERRSWDRVSAELGAKIAAFRAQVGHD